MHNVTTNSSGHIVRQNVTEYIGTSGGDVYQTNYIINATQIGYSSEAQSVNVTSSQSLTFNTLNNPVGSIILNAPANKSVFEVGVYNLTLNATVVDVYDDLIDVDIYGVNSTETGNFYKHGLLYQAKNVSANSDVVYNWTSPVTIPDNDTLLLWHFDNREEYGEDSTQGGSNTDYKYPSQTGDPLDGWTNGDNAMVTDEVFATETTVGEMLDTSNYNISIPEGAYIDGIRVRVWGKEGAESGPCPPPPFEITAGIGVDLSWDGGITYTSRKLATFYCMSYNSVILGGLTDLWGRTWNSTEFSNDNFRLRINFTGGDGSLSGLGGIDSVEVLVGYSGLIYDFSNYNRANGTPHSTSFNVSGGKFGGAYKSGYAGVLSDADVKAYPFTLSSWFYREGKHPVLDQGTIISIGNSGENTGKGYRLDTVSEDRVRIYSHNGSSSIIVSYTGTNLNLTNNWHHVVGVFENETKRNLYFDGELVAENDTAETGFVTNLNATYVGTEASSARTYDFNGMIDEVAVWNRSLSANEIRNLYRLKEGNYYWKVNVTDYAENNNESKTREINLTDVLGVYYCKNLTRAGATYTLYQDISTSGDCLIVSADNITIDGNGYKIDYGGAGSNNGVWAVGRANITVKNLNITDFYRGVWFTSTNNSLISNNSASGGNNGILLSSGKNNEIASNLVHNNGFGISTNGNNDTIQNNIAENNSYGIQVIGTNNIFTNNNLNLNTIGYLIQSATNDSVSGGVINNSKENAIRIGFPWSSHSFNTNLTNITIANTNASHYDIALGPGSTNGTYLIDMPHIGNYSFNNSFGFGSFVYLRDSTFGEIRFLESVNGSGTNLTNDVRIGNNSVVVESGNNIGLNRSANVTLYGIGDRGFVPPSLLRDGASCGSLCYNFTALDADTVRFNVSYWTNHSIGDITIPLVTIVLPENVTYNMEDFPLNFNVSLNENGSVAYSLDGGLNNVSMSANASGTGFNVSNGSIADGSYTFSVYANDIFGNNNFTASVDFSVSVTPPIITVNLPENKTYNADELPLNFNVSLNENGSVMYSLDGGVNNVTMGGNESELFGTMFNATNGSLADGPYTFSVYANDTIGNGNYTASVDFYFNNSLLTDCFTLGEASKTYYLNNNVTTSGTCFTITANNVVFDGQGYRINGSDSGSGVKATSRIGLTIRNLNIEDFSYGVDFVTTTISSISNNNISSNADFGVYLSSSSSSNTLQDNVLNSNSKGIYLTSSANNVISGGEVNGSSSEQILLMDSTSDNNNFTNVSFSNTGSSQFDIKLDVVGIDGTYLIDMPHIGSYSFAGNKVNFKKTGYGEINFLENLVVTSGGNNLSNDVRIWNNSVVVESGINSGLNKSANITLYGIGDRGFTTPIILRDGSNCPSAICSNFTSLTATDVIFNVDSWTNYSIGDDLATPVISIIYPTTTTYTSAVTSLSYTLSGNNLNSCWYSLNSGGTNTSLTCGANVSGISSIEGSNTWTVYANNTGGIEGNGSVTFTVDTSGGGSSSSSGGGGGGGGGGIVSTTQLAGFDVSKDLISVELKQGETKREIIRVTNIGSGVITIDDIGTELIDRFVKISEKSFSLSSGQSKEIVVDIFAGEDEKPDTYLGKIVVKSGNIQKTINVAIDVKGKAPLFDVIAKVEDETLMPGEDVTALIEIFNLGDLRNIDILLYYAVKDFDGNVIAFGEESLAIERRVAIIRQLNIPEDIALGKYVLYVQTSYNDITASSSKAFDVTELGLSPLFEKGSFAYYVLWVLIILGSVGIIVVTISIVRLLRRRKGQVFSRGVGIGQVVYDGGFK
ncbi:MAG: LamG-like jellyroll fold domain-containing protein [archaeon]